MEAPIPSPKSNPACRLRAFTLIELLTVIAILGILAAILIPVVGNVRKSAQAAQCISNLRQIGAATFLYLNDHDDRFFVRDGSRFNLLGKQGTSRPLTSDQRILNPYLGTLGRGDPVEIARCPADTGSVVLVGGGAQRVESAHDAFGSSYNANLWPGGLVDDTLRPIRLSDIVEPTRFVIFAEDPALTNANGETAVTSSWHWENEPMFNLLFADGHVGRHFVAGGARQGLDYTFFSNPPMAPTRPGR